jgi:hypothetical protein
MKTGTQRTPGIHKEYNGFDDTHRVHRDHLCFSCSLESANLYN